MQRSIETQEDVVQSQAEALKESHTVQSDETLGWKISFIGGPDENSRFLAPRNLELSM